MAISAVIGWRTVFVVLACTMATSIAYTIAIDGSPFRTENFSRWMVTTLIDFFTHATVLSIWMFYKEESWLTAIFWIVLVQTLGRNCSSSTPRIQPTSFC
ncbi:uncharacterized protein LOC111488955 isoform X3 [Cucurbita maxima]|uniref:Uncharacterized protein LOC111488955 isoform X3 n=1 Tax=Cucurbita maxima TaxID=3661 RepID=A0A6J1JU92_CUCMA|nr:uncharacterized protein LOC111488955 isoform X3 [Cucurbita maxima]